MKKSIFLTIFRSDLVNGENVSQSNTYAKRQGIQIAELFCIILHSKLG